MNGKTAKLIRNSVEGNPLAEKQKYRHFKSQKSGSGTTRVLDGSKREYRENKKLYRSLDEAGRAWFKQQIRNAQEGAD